MFRLVLAFFLISFVAVGTQAATSFEQLIVFGASFESGQLNPPNPIPNAGEYTWPHRLAEDLNMGGLMYAAPGASSSYMLSLLRDDYLLNGPPIIPGTVHVIGVMSDTRDWIVPGGPDQTTLSVHAENVAEMVRLLTEHGATNIYVTDQLTRGRSPFAYWAAQLEPDPDAAFEAFSTGFEAIVVEGERRITNAALAVNPNVKILRYGQFIGNLENNLGQWGFADEGYLLCFDSDREDLLCVGHPAYGYSGTQPDMTKLVFRDATHPTPRGHEVIAEYVASVFRTEAEPNNIPTMPLHALALIIIGLTWVTYRSFRKSPG